MPFFSILLPTKNRPQYLRETILSVLLQEFNSYELIISDNFNSIETQNVISEFITHPNIKYFSTQQELSMPDNWENALDKASGRYIMVLPDRKLLYKNALQTIFNKIKKYNEPDSCSWVVRVFDDLNQHMGWFPPNVKTNKIRLIKSDDLINNFISHSYLSPNSKDFFLPKSLNGCFKKELADRVKQITGHFFNNKYTTTPDYSSAFIQLALSKYVLHINDNIYLSQGEKTSNGRYSGNIDCMPYLSTLTCNDYYKYVPIKAPYIYNLLVNDFLVIKHVIGGNLLKYEIDKVNYYASLLDDLLSKKEIGLMSKKNLDFYEKEYFENFDRLNKEQKNKIKKRLKKIRLHTVKIPIFRNCILHIRDYINNNFTHIKFINNIMKYRFVNALRACDFKK